MNKILIFGGAFNPPHIGHLHILLKAQKHVNADKIIVCIDKIAPWKQIGDLVPYSYRKQMVKNLFDDKLDYQIYSNEKNYCFSYQIVKELSLKYKYSQLFFLVGQDQYELIKTWNKYDVINKLTTIVCYKRGKNKCLKLDNKHIILPDSIVDCSSTTNRATPSVKELGKENYQFIKDNYLYLQDKVKTYMSDYRYQHTLRVVDTITKIAMGNHFNDKDIWRCQLAGLLHDVAKEYKDEKLLKLVSKKELSTFPSWHCAHGLAGARLAKKDFDVKDKLVLDAIDNHVIVKDLDTSNKITKALFCADKLEPARTEKDIPDRKKHLDACCKNLNKEFLVVYDLNKGKY